MHPRRPFELPSRLGKAYIQVLCAVCPLAVSSQRCRRPLGSQWQAWRWKPQQDTNRKKDRVLAVSQGSGLSCFCIFFSLRGLCTCFSVFFFLLLPNTVAAVRICRAHPTEASLCGPLARWTIAVPAPGSQDVVWTRLCSEKHTVWIYRWLTSGLLEGQVSFTGVKVGVSAERTWESYKSRSHLEKITRAGHWDTGLRCQPWRAGGQRIRSSRPSWLHCEFEASLGCMRVCFSKEIGAEELNDTWHWIALPLHTHTEVRLLYYGACLSTYEWAWRKPMGNSNCLALSIF